MLTSLKAQNFRKHADLTIHFTPGINAIRAANEAGKSTALEAIAYAYFGTSGLKEAIDDVVTYGVPTNKLRVEHEFLHAGVAHRITRSPKGAELYVNGSDKPLVTGQTEVTKYMEKLFGTTQAMAGKLMLARQKDLGAALSGGPTAAGKMIEDLANLDLINELIALVGEKLPAGDTSAAKSNVETWRALTQPDLEGLPDITGLDWDVVSAFGKSSAAHEEYDDAQRELELMAAPAAEARQALADQRALVAAIEARARQILPLEEMIRAPIEPGPTEAIMNAARGAVEAQKRVVEAQAIYKALVAAKIEDEWDQPFPTLEVEMSTTELKITTLETTLTGRSKAMSAHLEEQAKLTANYRVARAQLEGKLVKDTSCTFCGKDLADVPEVAQVNSRYAGEITALEATYRAAVDEVQAWIDEQTPANAETRMQIAEAKAYLGQLRDVVKNHEKAELLYARAGEFIIVDRGTVPATWTWVGEPPVVDGKYAAKLQELEVARAAFQKATAQREQQVARLEELHLQQEKDCSKRSEIDIEVFNAIIAKFDAAAPRVRELWAAATEAKSALAQAEQALALAQQKRQGLLDQAEKAKSSLVAAEAVLAEMEANNTLVKKLRAARPAITDKLWAGVLGATSTYCEEVRGETSSITRVDGKFKINGVPVSGLSGSAEDALGLAIRFALTKTFLPAVDFVMLDEPAAACSEEREIAMLGLLATSGFAQTVLVTHSALCDAYADNIITI